MTAKKEPEVKKRKDAPTSAGQISETNVTHDHKPKSK
jgi:hypothetical protein